MTGPPAAVAAVRVAVRSMLAELEEASESTERSATSESPAPPGGGSPSGTSRRLVLVACSGGADSLALAAATAFEAPRRAVRAGAVVVDHGLQPGSEEVARRAAEACTALGLEPVVVVRADVAAAGPAGGPEAVARTARYEALSAEAKTHGADAVLLGHTRDDQAEQVLLGLVRGSGTRSLAGMPPRRDLLRRPFLQVTRAQTERACAAQALRPWSDPHNDDDRFTRVRARRLLALLRAELDPTVDAALARTADLARVDADALDAYAEALVADEVAARGWGCADLVGHPAAVTRRVWRIRAARLGIPSLSSTHVLALEELTGRRGLGPTSLPGGWRALRRGDRIHIEAPGRVE